MALSKDDDFSRSELIRKLRHLQVQVGMLSVESHEQMIGPDLAGNAPAPNRFASSDWAAIAAASDTLASDLETLILELDSR